MKKTIKYLCIVCMLILSLNTVIVSAADLPAAVSNAQIPAVGNASKVVEIYDNYIYNSSVNNVARAIGGMKISKSSTYKQYCYKSHLKIGILKSTRSQYSNELISYNQITDVINSGYKGVSFHGIRIGNSYSTVKARLEKNGKFRSYGNKYVFWNGNASSITLTFKNGKLSAYRWKLRYTS